ncbi:MAG TPA: membrane dipeptidase, partial [Deinococcales bacterium]|nr:membrane dipeptidase [Deinococcales bacterium]
MDTPPFPFFDGHNDTILRLYDPRSDRREPDLFFSESGEGHLDLPRARAAGMKGGIFAVYVPSPELGDVAASDPVGRPPAATPERPEALSTALRLLAGLFELERRSDGQFRIVRDA